MAVPSLRTLGIVVGVVLAMPLFLVVVVPLLMTFLNWLVGVPGAFLNVIVPGHDPATLRDQT